MGLTERFDESVLLLRRVMGWRTLPFYRSQNVNRKKAPIDDAQKEVIRAFNRYDIELYEMQRDCWMSSWQPLGSISGLLSGSAS